MDISAITVDRGTPRSTFLASVRASTTAAEAAEQAPGAKPSSGPPENLGITALRKNLEAAQAALRQAQENQAGQDAIESARQRVALAAQALAEAQLRQAQEQGGSAGSRGSVDTYA